MRNTVSYVRIAILGATLVASTAFAQRPARSFDPDEMLERQMTELKKDLSLTAEQEEQVRPILKDGIDKVAALRTKFRDSGGRPSPEMREEMTKIHQETQDELGNVLTSEQMEKYEKVQEERRSRFGEGRRRGRSNQ